MIENDVMDAIKNRRSFFRFKDEPVTEEQLDTILEAGRWAPSFTNSQPWEFIVVREEELKEDLYQIVEQVTFYKKGVKAAPAVIAVAVDPEKDSHHFLEDGAAATQNMALAAQSIGLGSYWIGLFDKTGGRGSAERKAKDLLGLPKNYRLISLLPVGEPDHQVKGSREKLFKKVHHEGFQG